MTSAPIAASGVWADMSLSVNCFDAPAPAAKATKSVSKDVSHAVVAAKVNAEIGNDIRWDIIMEEIALLNPAPLLHEKRTLPSKKIAESLEDSTSAGDTTDTDVSFSDAGDESPKSSKSVVRPPPGLAPPPGLTAPMTLAPMSMPPGLEDVASLPPPPGLRDLQAHA